MNKYLEKIALLAGGVSKPYTNSGNTGGGSLFVNRARYHHSTPPVANEGVGSMPELSLNAGLAVNKDTNFDNAVKRSPAQTKIEADASAKFTL